jgi:hypothetical protein
LAKAISRHDRPVELPRSLRLLTDGTDLEIKDHDALCLVTVDVEGWPHVALLSVGEVLSITPWRVRLGLWPNSTTTANLDRVGTGLLMFVADGAAQYVRLSGRRVHDKELDVGRSRMAIFELEAMKVTVDQVDYADLVSGVTYRLKHPAKVFERWRAALNRMGRV